VPHQRYLPHFRVGPEPANLPVLQELLERLVVVRVHADELLRRIMVPCEVLVTIAPLLGERALFSVSPCRQLRYVGRIMVGDPCQSLGPRVDARNRTVEGKDVSDAESTVVEREIRALVTVERQSTTVPKTSKVVGWDSWLTFSGKIRGRSKES
jgi:hypothetical protein